VRNSGWYIPFWRKPKRPQGEAGQQEGRERRKRPRTRSEEDLERVREEWVKRYTRRVQALRLLGLSVGTPQEEIEARYTYLVRSHQVGKNGDDYLVRLREAFETLRVDR
jgi:hypothetical protein